MRCEGAGYRHNVPIGAGKPPDEDPRSRSSSRMAAACRQAARTPPCTHRTTRPATQPATDIVRRTKTCVAMIMTRTNASDRGKQVASIPKHLPHYQNADSTHDNWLTASPQHNPPVTASFTPSHTKRADGQATARGGPGSGEEAQQHPTQPRRAPQHRHSPPHGPTHLESRLTLFLFR